MTRIVHDRMVNAAPLPVSRAVMAVANGLQDYTPEQQVMGAAAFFLMISEAYSASPQEVFTAVKNMIRADKYEALPQFNAAKQYIEKELA